MNTGWWGLRADWEVVEKRKVVYIVVRVTTRCVVWQDGTKASEEQTASI
jgi:hypothetical protein